MDGKQTSLWLETRETPVFPPTAHVTQVPDRRFREIASKLGHDGARTLVASSRAALDRIAAWVEGDRIDCDYQRDGVVHTVSPVCTHAGCIVGWNAAEKTWDCPCHGGRYTPSGEVIEGPPVKRLEPVQMQVKV